jgi:energy-coupling factor transporter ATP-binding protein EcfA2
MDIHLEGIAFTYPDGTQALRDVDLHIAAGESVAIVGANGSGKSTLVRHLDGLLRPSSGRVLIGGEETSASTVAQLAARVGLCFQHPDRMIFSSDVRGEVEFGPRHLDLPDDEVRSRVDGALDAVSLSERQSVHPHDLDDSGRKLLSIAAVLAMGTPVVVLDEPTTGLDPRGLARVETVIAGLREEGRTVIGISHDMRFVAETFERVLVMLEGRVVLDASVEEAFGEASWSTLRESGLEPPYAAVVGARLGLGSTASHGALIEALRRR